MSVFCDRMYLGVKWNMPRECDTFVAPPPLSFSLHYHCTPPCSPQSSHPSSHLTLTPSFSLHADFVFFTSIPTAPQVTFSLISPAFHHISLLNSPHQQSPGSLSRFPIGFIPTLTLSISPNSLHFWTHQLLPLAPFQMHHMKTQLANPKISMYSVRRSCNNTPKQASKKEYEGISSHSLRWQMRDVRILSATKQIAKFQLKSLHIRSKIKKKKQTAALPSFGVSILQAFRASASATPSNNGSGTLLHYSEGPTSTRAKPLFI